MRCFVRRANCPYVTNTLYGPFGLQVVTACPNFACDPNHQHLGVLDVQPAPLPWP